MTRRAISRLGALCAIAIAIASGSALAYFSAAGGGTAAAAVTTLGTPTISAATAATGGTVALTWKAVTAPDGSPVTYYVTRNGGEAAGTCPGAEEPETRTTCTDSGLAPGKYEYKVTAVWSTWSKTSAVFSATVTVGPVAKFTITGSSATPATGTGVNLVIIATDAAGGKVTTFTGSHNLIFEGAATSESGKAPTVVNASGTAVAFGNATALTFTTGEAKAASSKNGYLQIYDPGEAKITATEGSLTTPVPLALNVLPTASRFVLGAATTTPTAGVPVALTIKAYDAYGNLSTNYDGSKSVVFSGPANAPNGKVATVESNTGAQVNIGTATPITFEDGVALIGGETAGGELTVYKSGANSLTAKEGSTVTTPTALALTAAAAPAASLTLTTSTTGTILTTTAISLVTTAKDAYGNTATSFTGAKTVDFNATGAASETSPGAYVPGVLNSAGTTIPFGSDTAITFTNGIASVVSSKNGVLRLYKPGTASITVEAEELPVSAPLAFTIAIGAAKRVALTNVTPSAGSITSTTCFFTCTISGLGNSGTVTAGVMITDEYGNTITNIGAAKTVTVSSSGTAGSSISGSPMSIPATGTATSSTNFTYKAPSGTGAFSNTVTAAVSGYTTTTPMLPISK
jgi:hypothetical protein